MNESILLSIKKLLGPNQDVFDTDLIIHINTFIGVLQQIGVGSQETAFYITGDTETWSNFIGSAKDLEMIKTYIYLRVRLIFDPPTSSAVMDSFKKFADELEWRISVSVDPKNSVLRKPAIE